MRNDIHLSTSSDLDIPLQDEKIKHNHHHHTKSLYDLKDIKEDIFKLPSSDLSSLSTAKSSNPTLHLNERNSRLDSIRNNVKKDVIDSLLSVSRCSSIQKDDPINPNEHTTFQTNFSFDIENSPEISYNKRAKHLFKMKSFDSRINHRQSNFIIHSLDTTLNAEDKEQIISSFIEQNQISLLDQQHHHYHHHHRYSHIKTSSSENIFYENEDGYDTDLETSQRSNDDDDMDIIKIIRGGFYQIYEEIEIIGQGSSSTVKKCKKISTNEYYAVKVISYKGDSERLKMCKKEFIRHHQLNHNHIVKVYELYIDTLYKKIFTIMELVEGKQMSEYIELNGPFTEEKSCMIFKQLLQALAYLHTKGVCHRDIKPDNLIITNDGKTLKLIDFGVSKFCEDKIQIEKYNSLNKDNYLMYTQTGTKSFNPPEYYQDYIYTESLDIWSAGVTLYIMLCNIHPFEAEYLDDQIKKIIHCEYDLEQGQWQYISKEAKCLISLCLKKDYHERYTASQALMHSWISQVIKEEVIQIKEDSHKQNDYIFQETFIENLYYGDIGGNNSDNLKIVPGDDSDNEDDDDDSIDGNGNNNKNNNDNSSFLKENNNQYYVDI